MKHLYRTKLVIEKANLDHKREMLNDGIFVIFLFFLTLTLAVTYFRIELSMVTVTTANAIT